FTPTKLVISNPSKAIVIEYIKISGTNTSGIVSEKTEMLKVQVGLNSLVFNAESTGQLRVYNSQGQLIQTSAVHQGENTIMNSTKGLFFLKLTDKNGNLVGRKKLMR